MYVVANYEHPRGNFVALRHPDLSSSLAGLYQPRVARCTRECSGPELMQVTIICPGNSKTILNSRNPSTAQMVGLLLLLTKNTLVYMFPVDGEVTRKAQIGQQAKFPKVAFRVCTAAPLQLLANYAKKGAGAAGQKEGDGDSRSLTS